MECDGVFCDDWVVEDCVILCVADAVDHSDFAGIAGDGDEEQLEDVGVVS